VSVEENLMKIEEVNDFVLSGLKLGHSRKSALNIKKITNSKIERSIVQALGGTAIAISDGMNMNITDSII